MIRRGCPDMTELQLFAGGRLSLSATEAIAEHVEGCAHCQAALERFQGTDEIGRDVNTLPPNPGSHRPHQRPGFAPAVEAVYRPGEKAVTFYARAL